jgi:hypothetical protein
VDPELYSYLKFLRDHVLALENQAGTGSQSGSTSEDASSSGEFYTDISPATIASGTGTVAWAAIDVSAYVTAGATHVDLWVHIEVGSNGDQGSIDFGTDGATIAKQGPKTATAQSNTDTDSNTLVLRVPVTDAKLLYYQVTGSLSGTDSAWEIVIQGAYSV